MRAIQTKIEWELYVTKRTGCVPVLFGLTKNQSWRRREARLNHCPAIVNSVVCALRDLWRRCCKLCITALRLDCCAWESASISAVFPAISLSGRPKAGWILFTIIIL